MATPTVEHPETTLAVQEIKPDQLTLVGAPSTVLKEATKAAKALAQVIEAKPKKVVFNGKTYLQFEDWQTLGRFYGVTAVCMTTKYVEFGDGDSKVVGFEARADALLVGSNQVISSAEAMCLNDEANWSRKPLFQLKSMAQTRACAKALRNVLAWVVVLAGYAPTPAEEMEQESSGSGVQAPRRKSEIASGVSFNDQKRLFELGREKGMERKDVMNLIGRHGFEQPAEITPDAYQKIVAELGAA